MSQEPMFNSMIKRRIHSGIGDGWLVGHWSETDGSIPGQFYWYEVYFTGWFTDTQKQIQPVSQMGLSFTGYQAFANSGFVARGCDFEGLSPGPWICPRTPYGKIEDAVAAAISEWED